jgi:hypothetical protein
LFFLFLKTLRFLLFRPSICLYVHNGFEAHKSECDEYSKQNCCNSLGSNNYSSNRRIRLHTKYTTTKPAAVSLSNSITISITNTDSNAVPITNTFSVANSLLNSVPDRFSITHRFPNAYTHPNTHSHINPYSNTHGHPDPNANSDAFSYYADNFVNNESL